MATLFAAAPATESEPVVVITEQTNDPALKAKYDDLFKQIQELVASVKDPESSPETEADVAKLIYEYMVIQETFPELQMEQKVLILDTQGRLYSDRTRYVTVTWRDPINNQVILACRIKLTDTSTYIVKPKKVKDPVFSAPLRFGLLTSIGYDGGRRGLMIDFRCFFMPFQIWRFGITVEGGIFGSGAGIQFMVAQHWAVGVSATIQYPHFDYREWGFMVGLSASFTIAMRNK